MGQPGGCLFMAVSLLPSTQLVLSQQLWKDDSGPWCGYSLTLGTSLIIPASVSPLQHGMGEPEQGAQPLGFHR